MACLAVTTPAKRTRHVSAAVGRNVIGPAPRIIQDWHRA